MLAEEMRQLWMDFGFSLLHLGQAGYAGLGIGFPLATKDYCYSLGAGRETRKFTSPWEGQSGEDDPGDPYRPPTGMISDLVKLSLTFSMTVWTSKASNQIRSALDLLGPCRMNLRVLCPRNDIR